MNRAKSRCCKVCLKWGNQLIDMLIDMPYATLGDACEQVNIEPARVSRHENKCNAFRQRIALAMPKIRRQTEPEWLQELLDTLFYYPSLSFDAACERVGVNKSNVSARRRTDKWFDLEMRITESRKVSHDVGGSLVDIGTDELDLSYDF